MNIENKEGAAGPLHVGDSKFESWFASKDMKGLGTKQLARDAYAAGMSDPAVMPAAPSDAVWLIEDQDHFPRHRWLRIVEETKRAYLSWTEDANVAVRFGRRDDAVGFQKLHVDFCALSIVTGHTFMDMPAALSQPMQPQAEPAAGEQAGAVAYALQWPGEARLNLSTVFDTEAEASEYLARCSPGVIVVPLFTLAAPGAAIAAREQEDKS